ncbi:uncharacterized protein L969DRAFT_19444 [Mixia osmundae IAM 14324]|uniref:DNA replication regulator Sld3 C-terminal domain-containing protein n=1 Tax=Mixia osmundae (strain CBS 9802 / IAM 14324 / JCM 22182 / KY 12970) TaxID=764103 RepID=G7DUY0_MIXOS|nr:uncharacterized protein L969DRAFT_19444 [Mixia osmundae IAM 14324]KEI37393.1 hypothetical protein L969DRAFT_19444 [Mixia osmundae IAM 14324]GAA94390.1 hypothetical protein E5Q_01041 [Mixia osmundae IAM 14324]
MEPLLYRIELDGCPLPWPENPRYPTAPVSNAADHPVRHSNTTPSRADVPCPVPAMPAAVSDVDWLRREYERCITSSDAQTMKQYAEGLRKRSSRAQRASEDQHALVGFLYATIMPVETLDKRWRTEMPQLVDELEGAQEEQLSSLAADTEAHYIYQAMKRYKPPAQASQSASTHTATRWTNSQKHQWIKSLATNEAELQILLLLEKLVCDPFPQGPRASSASPNKSRTRAHLDPERTIDMLVERLALQQVMSSIGTSDEFSQTVSESPFDDSALPLDPIQQFWQSCVEGNYSGLIADELLASCRERLFPSSPDDIFATSPVKQPVEDVARLARSVDEARRSSSTTATGSLALSKVFTASESQTSAMIATGDNRPGLKDLLHADSIFSKQHARTFARSTSGGITSRNLFRNREVQVGVKSQPKVQAKKGISSKQMQANKRKLSSPKRAVSSETLVLATPAKNQGLSRAMSMPSFAELGAAFRLGSRAGGIPEADESDAFEFTLPATPFPAQRKDAPSSPTLANGIPSTPM